MPGHNYNPLGLSGEFDSSGNFHISDDSQYMRFRRAAKAGDLLDELIGLTTSSTGLRTAAMAHMRDTWWINGKNQKPHIEVPYAEECVVGRPNGNQATVCYRCRTRATKNFAPDDADWTPKSEAGARPIPIRDQDTISILDSYFKVYDSVASQNTVLTRVKKIGDRADIGREVVVHDLRDTYGTLLAKKGFGPHKIKYLMGHANIEEAEAYVKLVGKDVQEEYDDKW